MRTDELKPRRISSRIERCTSTPPSLHFGIDRLLISTSHAYRSASETRDPSASRVAEIAGERVRPEGW